MWIEDKLRQRGKERAASLLAIIGGVVGVIAGVVAMIAGGTGMFVVAEAERAIWLGSVAAIFGLVGVVAGGLVRRAPFVAGTLMLLTGFGGFVAVTLYWILPGGLLIIGSIIAWTVRSEREIEPEATG